MCVRTENSALRQDPIICISNSHSLLILQVNAVQNSPPSETQALHSPAGFVSDLSLSSMPEHRQTNGFCSTARGFLFSQELCARFSTVARLLIFSDLLPSPQPSTPPIKIDFSSSRYITISRAVLALLLDNVKLHPEQNM